MKNPFIRPYALIVAIFMLTSVCTSVFGYSGADNPYKLIDYTVMTYEAEGSVNAVFENFELKADNSMATRLRFTKQKFDARQLKSAKIRIDKLHERYFEKSVFETEIDVSDINDIDAGASTVKNVYLNLPVEDKDDGTYLVYVNMLDDKGQVVYDVLSGRENVDNEILLAEILVSHENGARVVHFYPIKKISALNPAQSDKNAFVFRKKNEINIDGNLNEWDKAYFDYAPHLGNEKKAESFSSDVAFSWDDEYLYVAEKRKDNILSFDDVISRDLYQSDNLRLYISNSTNYNDRSMFGENDYVIIINPNIIKGEPIYSVDAYPGSNTNIDVSKIITKIKPVSDKKGWTMEMAIPFSILNIKPESGMELGVQLIADDADVSMVRDESYCWNLREEGAFWQGPQGFARMIFMDDFENNLMIQTKAQSSGLGVGEYLSLKTDFTGAQSVSGTASVKFSGEVNKEIPMPVNLKRFDMVFSAIELKEPGKMNVNVEKTIDGETYSSASFASEVLPYIDAMEKKTDGRLNNIVSDGTSPIPALFDDNYTNEVVKTEEGYELRYHGSEEIVYKYKPVCGRNSEIETWINGVKFFTGAENSGINFVFGEEKLMVGDMSAEILSQELKDNKISVKIKYDKDGKTATADYKLSIQGKTLILEVETDQTANAYSSGFNGFGKKLENITYMLDYVNISYGGGVFLSSYFDPKCSNASSMSKDGVTYSFLTDGSYNKLREKLYVTFSTDIEEVFPEFDNGISPYRDEISQKLMIDWWGHYEPRSNYKYMKEYAQYLYDYDFKDIIFMRHFWQRDGYDMSIPDVLPSREEWGGDAELIPAGKAMKDFGWRFGLHTNYTDYSPVTKMYTPERAILNQNGNIRMGGTFGGITNYMIKPTSYMYFINMIEPLVHSTYSTTMSFVDVFGARTHSRDVDFDATSEGAGMHRTVTEKTTEAIKRIKEIHNGPFFSEGGSEAVMYSGIIDGVEAQMTGEYSDIVPDFNITKVIPLSMNHGMGYYSRWRQRDLADNAIERSVVDKYRLQELAYGHEMYFEDRLPHSLVTEVFKEYYLMLAIQKQYGLSSVQDIYYLDGDKKLTLSEAYKTNYFDKEGIRMLEITYQNGLKLLLNAGGGTYMLGDLEIPEFGFVVENDKYVATSGIMNGKWGDMSVSENEVFFDSRTSRHFYENLKIAAKITDARMTGVPGKDGNGEISLDFEWTMNDEIPEAASLIILHLYDENGANVGPGGDRMVEGEMKKVKSGVYRPATNVLALPADLKLNKYYTIGTTFLNLGNGERYDIMGSNAAHMSIVGRVMFTEENGEIKFEFEQPEVDRGNNAGESVDFGKVICDGMFKAEKKAEGWELMLLPRETTLNLTLKDANVTEIVALGNNGKPTGNVDFEKEGSGISVRFDNLGARTYLIKGDINWADFERKIK